MPSKRSPSQRADLTSRTLRALSPGTNRGRFISANTFRGSRTVASLSAVASAPADTFEIDFARDHYPSPVAATIYLTHTPIDNSLHLYLNGLLLDQGIDFTLTGSQITFTSGVVATGDTVIALYALSTLATFQPAPPVYGGGATAMDTVIDAGSGGDGTGSGAIVGQANLPTGTAVGNLLLMGVRFSGNILLNTPPGWALVTAVGTDIAVFSKTATSSDLGATVPLTIHSGREGLAVIIAAYTAGSITQIATGTGAEPFTQPTVNVDPSTLVVHFARGSSSVTGCHVTSMGASVTQRAEQADGQQSLGLGDWTPGTTGVEPGQVPSSSPTTDGGWAGITLAIRQ